MIAIATTRERATQERSQEKFRRLLLLVDVLAPCRTYQSVESIRARINERCGIQWTARTVQRDLLLLDSMGFIESCHVLRNRGGQQYGYRLNLRTTEGLQVAALRL